MNRELVETMLAMAEDGGTTPVPAPLLAELCRAWLRVQDAPAVELRAMFALGHIEPELVACADGLPGTWASGLRVRLVRDKQETK